MSFMTSIISSLDLERYDLGNALSYEGRVPQVNDIPVTNSLHA